MPTRSLFALVCSFTLSAHTFVSLHPMLPRFQCLCISDCDFDDCANECLVVRILNAREKIVMWFFKWNIALVGFSFIYVSPSLLFLLLSLLFLSRKMFYHFAFLFGMLLLASPLCAVPTDRLWIKQKQCHLLQTLALTAHARKHILQPMQMITHTHTHTLRGQPC